MKIFYIIIFTVFSAFQVKSQTHANISLQELDPIHVKFYPNPATAYINFEFSKESDNKPYTLQIYNFMGKKVYENSTMDTKILVTLTEFNRGIYIFQLKDQNGTVVDAGKFQVNK
jgi:hypothetical protein